MAIMPGVSPGRRTPPGTGDKKVGVCCGQPSSLPCVGVFAEAVWLARSVSMAAGQGYEEKGGQRQGIAGSDELPPIYEVCLSVC